MTTHKAHVSLFYNQCLALQAVAILLELGWARRSPKAVWTYERAARHVLPDLYEGQPERPMPQEAIAYLPKVMLCDHDDDTITEALR